MCVKSRYLHVYNTSAFKYFSFFYGVLLRFRSKLMNIDKHLLCFYCQFVIEKYAVDMLTFYYYFLCKKRKGSNFRKMGSNGLKIWASAPSLGGVFSYLPLLTRRDFLWKFYLIAFKYWKREIERERDRCKKYSFSCVHNFSIAVCYRRSIHSIIFL